MEIVFVIRLYNFSIVFFRATILARLLAKVVYYCSNRKLPKFQNMKKINTFNSNKKQFYQDLE